MKLYNTFAQVLILGTLCLTACKNKVENSNPIKHVNLEVRILDEEIPISDEFCDFEIIPLDNRTECMMSDIDKMIVTDSGMYFWDNNGLSQQVLSFNPDGTFKCKIGSRGHGRGEYPMINSIAANRKGDTVAVICYPSIYFYDDAGNYLSTWKFEDGAEDMLFTDDKLYLGCFHGQGNSLVTSYSKKLSHVDDIIDTPSGIKTTFLDVDNGHIIQQDGDNICCLDALDSKFYVFNNHYPKDMTCYSFNMDNMRTISDREKDVNEDGTYHITSYSVYKNVVRGQLDNRNKYYDFKFTLGDNVVTLMHHSDKSYGFDCNFKGYFYQIVPAYFMLDYIDLKKRHLESMRNLFKDKLEGFRGKVSMSDNYYIMKMKIRE